jgi:hypothetical protein
VGGQEGGLGGGGGAFWAEAENQRVITLFFMLLPVCIFIIIPIFQPSRLPTWC